MQALVVLVVEPGTAPCWQEDKLGKTDRGSPLRPRGRMSTDLQSTMCQEENIQNVLLGREGVKLAWRVMEGFLEEVMFELYPK